MASVMIHLCVAKKVNEYLHMDEKDLFLGSIAPDLSKQIGSEKMASHFLDSWQEYEIPNVNRFLRKYRYDISNAYEMGYLIHLLTDRYWFRDYVDNYIKRHCQEKGKELLTYTGLKNLIYKDYTNLNLRVIEKYDLPLDIFMNEIEYPQTNITEVPIEDLHILIEKMGIIIQNSHKKKTLVFDIDDITLFIENCSKKIIEDIKDIFNNEGEYHV